MASRDRVTGPAQILCQVHLHQDRRLERHRVQVLMQFRQEAGPQRLTIGAVVILPLALEWVEWRGHNYSCPRVMAITADTQSSPVAREWALDIQGSCN
jgi:hypothetical protein